MQNQSDVQKIRQDIQRDLQSGGAQGQQPGSIGSGFASQAEAQKVKQDIQRDLQS